MSDRSTQVIISGAGPVGAVAAYALALRGVDVIVLEAFGHCPEDLRASTLHPPTLEMLDQLGLFEDLDALGLRAPVYQYRNRQTGQRLSFDLSELADITSFPFRLQCEQFKLSRTIVDRLGGMSNAEVRFSNRVIGFEQDSAGVSVHVETPFAVETIRGDFLVGCDGANSTIRKLLDIGFEGFTYPEKFVTFSTEFPFESFFEDLAHVNYVADPDEWMVILRVPGLWRVLVPAGEHEDSFLKSDKKKQDVFQRLVGDPTIRTEHRTIYKVHQRVAKRYVAGRVVLAGDAAHLNNPLGGFGMNSGIHDVWKLTEQLDLILRHGGNPDRLLKDYELERQAVMREFVQTQTIKNKEALERSSPQEQAARESQMANILNDDRLRRDYLLYQSMFKSLQKEKVPA